MQWFKINRDLSQGKRMLEFMRRFRQVAREPRYARQFLAALGQDGGVLPQFFEKMFDDRGNSGDFSGRAWRPVSPDYLRRKIAQFNESRTGHRTLDLRKSLTQSADRRAIRRLVGGQIIFGSSVKYASHFNSERPVIDKQTSAEVLTFLTTGPGAREFTRLVLRLKGQILQQAAARSGALR